MGGDQWVEWTFAPGLDAAKLWPESGPLAGVSLRSDVTAGGVERMASGQYGWHVEGFEGNKCGDVS